MKSTILVFMLKLPKFPGHHCIASPLGIRWLLEGPLPKVDFFVDNGFSGLRKEEDAKSETELDIECESVCSEPQVPLKMDKSVTFADDICNDEAKAATHSARSSPFKVSTKPDTISLLGSSPVHPVSATHGRGHADPSVVLSYLNLKKNVYDDTGDYL